MFVVNFDFSDHILPLKLLAINIPVAITEIIAYPLQRLQTLLISQTQNIGKSQFKQVQLLLRNMISIEGFPKCLHGMRYSVDYMGTQMTAKFLLFDFLIDKTMDSIKSNQKIKLVANCFIANAFSTVVSQIAFNYQTIASSLPIDKKNRSEDVKIILEKYTQKKKIPIDGLKYTLPISILNTTVQLLVLNLTADWIAGTSKAFYIFTDLLTAFTIFTSTAFFSHYAFQRQVQICKGLPEKSIPYKRGLLGSLIRYNAKGLTLFSLYLLYFEIKTKNDIERFFEKRNLFQSEVQSYRQ